MANSGGLGLASEHETETASPEAIAEANGANGTLGTAHGRRGDDTVDEVEALLPDGGLLALGLSPAPPSLVAVPAERRLTDARDAIEHFDAQVASLERERETVVDEGRRAELDETLAIIRQRLQIARIAERAIAAEVASAGERSAELE